MMVTVVWGAYGKRYLLQALDTSLHEAINAPLAKMRVKTPDKILRLLVNDLLLTLAEMADHLALSKSTVERAVGKLKQQGKLCWFKESRALGNIERLDVCGWKVT